MLRHSPTLLALTFLAGAADSPSLNPLEVIHAGNYSTTVPGSSNLRILNWNIDRGQHFQGIVRAIRETRPDLCIFQEVDLGARRTHGEDVAEELAKTFGMNYTFAAEFRELGQSTAAGPGLPWTSDSQPLPDPRLAHFTLHASIRILEAAPLADLIGADAATAFGRADCLGERTGPQRKTAGSL